MPFQTKGILLIVATEWMGADGGSCYPSFESPEIAFLDAMRAARAALARKI